MCLLLGFAASFDRDQWLPQHSLNKWLLNVTVPTTICKDTKGDVAIIPTLIDNVNEATVNVKLTLTDLKNAGLLAACYNKPTSEALRAEVSSSDKDSDNSSSGGSVDVNDQQLNQLERFR